MVKREVCQMGFLVGENDEIPDELSSPIASLQGINFFRSVIVRFDELSRSWIRNNIRTSLYSRLSNAYRGWYLDG